MEMASGVSWNTEAGRWQVRDQLKPLGETLKEISLMKRPLQRSKGVRAGHASI